MDWTWISVPRCYHVNKANKHEKGEPRVGRGVSPIFQENNGTEKRWPSTNLHLVQCLEPWPKVPGSSSLNRKPFPNHLSFKALKNNIAYLWIMAVNKHSSHRHNVFMNTSASTYWWRFYKDWPEKNHVSLLFGPALLLHLKAFALTTTHYSTTVPRFLHNTHLLALQKLDW